MDDQRAYKILHDSYWSAAGWNLTPQTTPQDFKYAKEAGLMFDPVTLSHQDIVNRARSAYAKVSKESVVNGFLASLSTRRLELRSALGSYAIARHFPQHRFTGKLECLVCGVVGKKKQEVDLSRLNFERYKWGGVFHWDPIYIGFDLDQFTKIVPPAPSPEDYRILRQIIQLARQLDPEDRPAVLEKSFGGLLASNTQERRMLIQILSYCGILQPAGFKSYYHEFITYHDRPERPVYKIDWSYPICWYQGKHGVNEAALDFYFPDLFSLCHEPTLRHQL